MCFANGEQLSNQSTLFRPAPLGSNRKYSQDFLSLLQALKQDTSAGPASKKPPLASQQLLLCKY